MPSAAPTAQLEARISTELDAMLKRAAEIQGRSMTDFGVSAVQEQGDSTMPAALRSPCVQCGPRLASEGRTTGYNR